MAAKFFRILFILFIFSVNFINPSTSYANTSDGQVLFSDDFNDGNFNGWNVELGNWVVTNGYLQSKVSGRINIPGEIHTGDPMWDNYALELDVNNVSGIDEAIEFRKLNSNNSYAFNLRHGTGSFDTPQIKLFKKINGVDNVISSTRSQQLVNNTWYHIKIEVLEDNIKLLVNNNEVINYTDHGTSFKKGGIGLGSWTGVIGFIDVRFDNVKVIALGGAPQPFLDLPWDYEGQGLDFNEAALSMTSYFDHEYPLLSSVLGEPIGNQNSVVFYSGGNRRTDIDYSAHDGYDYSKLAKVNIGDSVLAAAPGWATYDTSCGWACGNMIVIDHGNGYQTRYLHMQKDGLVTDTPGQKVWVNNREVIGKVGATGNVSPAGDAGAHIHFGVFQDKNNDGNFEDNIPDGVTDPFGWQSSDPDPWPSFIFNYGGRTRTGNKSYYLWKKKIENLDSTLDANGGIFNVGRYNFNFPAGATSQTLNIHLQSSANARASNSLISLGSTMIATANDNLGKLVTQFFLPFTIQSSFNQFDLSKFNKDSLSFYFSQDGVNWTKTPTTISWDTQIATAQVLHFTHFALMAERLDTTAPETMAVITGDKGQEKWYRSNISVNLNAKDNDGGLGVDYTMYKLDNNDWEIYKNPINFTDEGHHKIDFYSVDKDDNIESFKSLEFNIDKTPPEAKVYIDQDKQDLVVIGVDKNQTTVTKIDNDETQKKDDSFYIISDFAGNTLKLDVRDRDKEKQDRFSIFSLVYNENPKITQPDNHYNVSYQGKKDKLNIKEENFEIKKEVKLKIEYDSKNNKCTITTKEAGVEKTKEEKIGLILLQLNTNQGNLEYSY